MQEKNQKSQSGTDGQNGQGGQMSKIPQTQIEEKYNKPYDPQKVEDAIYEKWQKSGYFNPDNLPQGKQTEAGQRFTKPYTIVMPPPNANGDLHVGHSLSSSHSLGICP